MPKARAQPPAPPPLQRRRRWPTSMGPMGRVPARPHRPSCLHATPYLRALRSPHGRRRPASCSFHTGSSRTSAPRGGRQVALAGRSGHRAGPSPQPVGGAVHRAPQSRPPQRAQRSPHLPLPISRFPGSDSQQTPPAQSRIGPTRPGIPKAPPPARAHETHGTYETNGTARGRRPPLLPPAFGAEGRGVPRWVLCAGGRRAGCAQLALDTHLRTRYTHGGTARWRGG